MRDIDDTQQPLLEHLIELRRRLLYCVASLLVTFFVSMYFSKEIYGVLVHPLAAAGQNKIVFTQIFGAFFVQLKVAFFAAMMLSFPVVATQLWRFVAPGLYRQEKKALLPFLLATPILFIAGACLAYFIAIPTALHFLLGYQGDLGGGVTQEALPEAEKYLDFVMQFLFAFGITFLLPVLLMLLERSGIVTYEQLKGAWRYAVVAAFAIAAVLTPPDIGSQLLLAFPLVGLYFLSLVAIWFTRRRRQAEDSTEIAEA
ncbi:twin-arginine translocase subunit TatC [Sphingomonas sp. HITSZ_GF]|uniref:twin-arginine translocase subunit TatC n=1 Tax=Sphingomonas sp. HITSZ_GF TaxID=3037247 RepID=UPI00240DAACB|nr:twin-arginine translocase subunit TatC [Sphingomonas sp. HITSZ_GF]MDG2535980.1 twin-arginine translocase subunit TatC [Sphingomonas sp. HITSZ_GF]